MPGPAASLQAQLCFGENPVNLRCYPEQVQRCHLGVKGCRESTEGRGASPFHGSGAVPDWKFKNQLAAVGGALDARVAGIFIYGVMASMQQSEVGP